LYTSTFNYIPLGSRHADIAKIFLFITANRRANERGPIFQFPTTPKPATRAAQCEIFTQTVINIYIQKSQE